MIPVFRVFNSFVEDCIQGLSSDSRIQVRKIVRSLPSDDLSALLQACLDSESALISGTLDCYPNARGSLLQIFRFLRKMSTGTIPNREKTLKAFAERQDSLLYEDLEDDVHHCASTALSLILGEQLPDWVPAFKHGPGSVAEGALGLDKSSVPLAWILEDNNLTQMMDPIKRLRTEPMITRTRVSLVEKDWRGGRVIGMEPTWNMVLQLGLKDWLEHRTFTWVPYYDQTRQERMLLEKKHLRLGTVDLSNASDHVSVDLCKAILPSNWFAALYSVRSPTYKLSDNSIGITNSMALMGNGFCFPLLSSVVLALAMTAMSIGLGEPVTIRNMRKWQDLYGVQNFGDDLVFPVDLFPVLNFVFAQAGLVINHEKTGLGAFRETCGKYQFGDENPFRCYYLRSSEWSDKTYDGLCSLHNVLKRHGYGKTASTLEASCPSWVARQRPQTSPSSNGLECDDADVRRTSQHLFKSRATVRHYAKREVSLADASGWFSAFHGGIPREETVSYLGLRCKSFK